MKNLHLVVGALILFLVGGCNQEPVHEQSIEQYFSESFSDLDIETLAALETPYEGLFGNQTNARSKGGFADIAEILDKLDEVFPDADVLEIESKSVVLKFGK